MTKKLTINVRPQDGDSTNVCSLDPVAQALREAVGLSRATPATASRFDAFAQPTRLYAVGARLTIMCDTPPAVAAWIKRWDATGEGAPFSFEVEAQPTDRRAPINFVIPGAQMPTARPAAR